MILAGVLWGTANGNLSAVTQSLIDSAGAAVSLALTMLGIMSFWCRILQVGMNAGLIDWFTGKMGPLLDFLFPDVKDGHPARKPLAVNLAANMLGVGMAATPAGLEAMKALAKESRRGKQCHVYLSGSQCVISAADSCFYDCLPQSVSLRGSGSCGRSCVDCDRLFYTGSCYIL